jgi:hypothetical protein
MKGLRLNCTDKRNKIEEVLLGEALFLALRVNMDLLFLVFKESSS